MSGPGAGGPAGDDGPAVAVADLQARPIDPDALARLAAGVLRAEGRTDVALSVTVVDDERMAALHVEYSGVEGPTDVLAFPLLDPDDPPTDEPPLLGEVVVSADTAAREATARGLAFERELGLYVVHGVLHLLGWDDQDDDDRARMHARQEALLDALLA